MSASKINAIKDERVTGKGKDSVSILFQGTKHYWRTRTMIDIIIAHHQHHRCIEVVAYNPEVDVEASRLYIDYDNLVRNLNHNDCDEKLAMEIELMVRQKVNFSRKDIACRVVNDIICNNIQSQLMIHGENSAKDFSVSLKYDFGIDIMKMMETNHISNSLTLEQTNKRIQELAKLERILITKPTLLQPIRTSHFKHERLIYHNLYAFILNYFIL